MKILTFIFRKEVWITYVSKQIVKCQNAKTSMIKSFMQNANDIIKKDFVTSSSFEEKIIRYLLIFCNKYLARNWFGSERFWSPEWASTLSSSSSPVTQSGRPESSNFMCKDYKYQFIWNQSLCNFPNQSPSGPSCRQTNTLSGLSKGLSPASGKL